MGDKPVRDVPSHHQRQPTQNILSEHDTCVDFAPGGLVPPYRVIAALIIAFTACSSPTPRSRAVATRHLADTPTLTLTDSSADPSHEFNGISSALRLADGRILVANAGILELTLPDSTGAFLGAVGRQGPGRRVVRYRAHRQAQLRQ